MYRMAGICIGFQQCISDSIHGDSDRVIALSVEECRIIYFRWFPFELCSHCVFFVVIIQTMQPYITEVGYNVWVIRTKFSDIVKCVHDSNKGFLQTVRQQWNCFRTGMRMSDEGHMLFSECIERQWDGRWITWESRWLKIKTFKTYMAFRTGI